MSKVAIPGFDGTIETGNLVDAVVLAETLLHDGFAVEVDGGRVRIEYGPGYDTVVWAEGDSEGQPVNA